MSLIPVVAEYDSLNLILYSDYVHLNMLRPYVHFLNELRVTCV